MNAETDHGDGSRAPAGSRLPAFQRRESLTDGVYDWLKQLVVQEHFAPGSPVRIEPLARQLGVSPTPVREALARLESDGLVERESMRGYRVTALLDEHALGRLYDLRLLIEPAMTGWAATRSGKEGLRRLRTIVTDMATFAEEGLSAAEPHSYGTFAGLDSDFHETIARASDNEFLLDTLTRMRQQLHLARRHYGGGLPADAAQTTVREHWAILAALQDHDQGEAEQRMRVHLTNSQHRMITTARPHRPSPAPPPDRRQATGLDADTSTRR